ncbi:hypothetical protein GBAR_LOCUS18253, partial [Geodia barretti]
MTITQPEHGIIGVNGTWTVQHHKIDFFIREPVSKEKLLADMLTKENAGFYPP